MAMAQQNHQPNNINHGHLTSATINTTTSNLNIMNKKLQFDDSECEENNSNSSESSQSTTNQRLTKQNNNNIRVKSNLLSYESSDDDDEQQQHVGGRQRSHHHRPSSAVSPVSSTSSWLFCSYEFIVPSSLNERFVEACGLLGKDFVKIELFIVKLILHNLMWLYMSIIVHYAILI